MSRLVALVALAALVWVVVFHREQLVYTLGGFAVGMAVTSALPWFVRWGQRQGTGGVGVRIPVRVDEPDQVLDNLRRRGEATESALRAANVPEAFLSPTRSRLN